MPSLGPKSFQCVSSPRFNGFPPIPAITKLSFTGSNWEKPAVWAGVAGGENSQRRPMSTVSLGGASHLSCTNAKNCQARYAGKMTGKSRPAALGTSRRKLANEFVKLVFGSFLFEV